MAARSAPHLSRSTKRESLIVPRSRGVTPPSYASWAIDDPAVTLRHALVTERLKRGPLAGYPVVTRRGVGSADHDRRRATACRTAGTGNEPPDRLQCMTELITDGAYGTGLATVTADGTVLDVWYPAPGAVLLDSAHHRAAGTAVGRADRRHPRRPADDHPGPDRLARRRSRSAPRTPTCGCTCCPRGWSSPGRSTWTASSLSCRTTPGPRSARSRADDLERVRLEAVNAGIRLSVFGVDKFPRMTDYVLPSGVRIAHADRVRLGAHLAPGTTVMHEGFVQLQRRHHRHLDGGGPDLAGRDRR